MGIAEGSTDGILEGGKEGISEGSVDGLFDGTPVGLPGVTVGAKVVGVWVGFGDGSFDG